MSKTKFTLKIMNVENGYMICDGYDATSPMYIAADLEGVNAIIKKLIRAKGITEKDQATKTNPDPAQGLQ